jgi:predicted PurR-regulated permease PerM
MTIGNWGNYMCPSGYSYNPVTRICELIDNSNTNNINNTNNTDNTNNTIGPIGNSITGLISQYGIYIISFTIVLLILFIFLFKKRKK